MQTAGGIAPGADSGVGVSVRKGNVGEQLGTAPVNAKGPRRNGEARGSQGSAAADPQKLFILQSSCDVGCPRKGARPRAGDSSHLRPPLNKAHSYGLSAGSTPSCWINKSFLPKGKYRHPLHTTTTPNWQHRAQCQSPPP